MPLALVGDLVARCPEHLRKVGRARLQLRLAAALRPKPQRTAAELPQCPASRRPAPEHQPGEVGDDGGPIAGVGLEVGRGQGQSDAMAGRVEAREEGRAAGRAHRRVAETVAEGQPCPRQLGLIGHQLSQPAWVVRPVPRPALLVGDQQQEVRRAHRRRAYRGASTLSAPDRMPRIWIRR